MSTKGPEMTTADFAAPAGVNLPALHIQDPGSAITHFIAAIASIAAAPFLVERAIAHGGDFLTVASCIVFAASLILLYSASTIYHTVPDGSRIDMTCKKWDHLSIFILIAGTYTPVCLIGLRADGGVPLLIAVWAVAVLGIAFKLWWVTCPKWMSSVMYIAMGWLCVFAFPAIIRTFSAGAFGFLLAGGIAYTLGGVLYSCNLRAWDARHPWFGTHEIFHVFVMLGSLLQFICIYQFLL